MRISELTIEVCNPAGTWGGQLGLKDMQLAGFADLAISVTCFRGTDNTNRITEFKAAQSPVGYMTTEDAAL